MDWPQRSARRRKHYGRFPRVWRVPRWQTIPITEGNQGNEAGALPSRPRWLILQEGAEAAEDTNESPIPGGPIRPEPAPGQDRRCERVRAATWPATGMKDRKLGTRRPRRGSPLRTRRGRRVSRRSPGQIHPPRITRMGADRGRTIPESSRSCHLPPVAQASSLL